MKKLHEKSPCCHGRIIKFGNRRRQCVVCRKTWRVYQKKKGRKKKRESSKLIVRYLNHEIPSFYGMSRSKRTSKDTFKRRIRKSQLLFLKKTHWPILPTEKPLIVVADAMVQIINHQIHTIYFILLRKPQEDKAIILKPLIRKGPEVAQGWYKAFKTIPLGTRSVIKVLVCDGHVGLISVSHKYGWLIQRCHFHHIARIQNYCSKFKLSRSKRLGKLIYRLTIKVLTEHDEENIIQCLDKLRDIYNRAKSRALKKVLSGFIKHYHDYRTYLYYPEFKLPRTSNAIESLIGGIRSLFHRARGFRTLSSITHWIHTFLKSKQRVTCNGFHQPN